MFKPTIKVQTKHFIGVIESGYDDVSTPDVVFSTRDPGLLRVGYKEENGDRILNLEAMKSVARELDRVIEQMEAMLTANKLEE